MKIIKQNVPVNFSYDVLFTEDLFAPANSLFADVVGSPSPESARKVLFVIDKGVADHHPSLIEDIKSYASGHAGNLKLVQDPVLIPGGEQAKNIAGYVTEIHKVIHEARLDRHSCIAAIGGGAVLDTVGYAAATAHRGIRLVRIPTTVLAQNDAGIGVKNGINAFGKKNFLGTFNPPFAVINDASFLRTLEDRDWKSGISEAIKVALLKDKTFFDFLEDSADKLAGRDHPSMQHLVYRCAELHLEHISTSGDPFEMGSSRPLDFGHWSAHKLEQLTDYELRHGEAVAIGLALDSTYSYLSGMLSKGSWKRILNVIQNSGLRIFVPELALKTDNPQDPESIFHGLEEFREHLGGELTIMLLEDIGKGTEVHSVDYSLFSEAVQLLHTFDQQPV
ncbi:MAG: 3-dehydroquinate synthase [Balneolales bacterium]